MATSTKAQLAFIAVGAALLTGAIVMFGLPPRDDGPAVSMPADSPAAVTAPVPTVANVPARPETVAEPAEQAVPPAFDIVRVGPTGDSVIAGRAAPGKVLELLVNGKVHDRVEVRESGAFALTPPPLPPGDHELTLREIGADGTETLSRQSVTVVLSPDSATPPVVALAEPDKPTALLSSAGVVARSLHDTDEAAIIADVTADEEAAAGPPDAAPAAPSPPAVSAPAPAPEKVVIAAVEAEAGRLYVSGQAPPEAAVRLYLNDTFLAQGKASDGGAISFRIDSGVPAGDYSVRLDQVVPGDGKVQSRAEVAFAMPEASLQDPQAATPAAPADPGDGSHVVVPEVRTVRVDRGDSLWRISRRIYGSGVRYTVIYDANQEQIRNPDRIYPGQLFVLPANRMDAARPAGEDGGSGR